MLRHLLLALILVPLIILLSVKIDAFNYNRASQISYVPESHVENTYHPHQKTALDSPISSKLYQTPHAQWKYKHYGRQAHYRLHKPRVQYVRQIITPRKARPSRPWIRPLHPIKRTSGTYIPQVFVQKKRMGTKQKHSKKVKYQPRYSNKRIFPQRQKPLTLNTKKTMPYQPTYSPIRKDASSPHTVVGTNYNTDIHSKSMTNHPTKDSAKKITAQTSLSSPLSSNMTSKYTPIVPDGNEPKHSDVSQYSKENKPIPTMANVLDAIMKPSNSKTRQYLSSIPDGIDSEYAAVWPYGSNDGGVPGQVKDGGINALPGYSDGEEEMPTRTGP